MSKTLNWGIMGAGVMAREFSETLSKVSNFYAVASRTKESRQYFEDTYGVIGYESYEEFVNDPNIDIVYIATVNSLHYANIKLALEARKHVLCEKAIWHNYKDMFELQEIAKTNNLILSEGITLYHMPLIKEIRKQVLEGRIGKVKYVKADLGSTKDDAGENRFFSKEVGGGAMLDIGTYTLSFINLFMSENIVELNSISVAHETGVDESWSISLLDDNGVIGSSNIGLKGKLPKTAVVSGDKGHYFIDNYVRGEEATFVSANGEEEVIYLGEADKALEYEIKDIEEAVLGESDYAYTKESVEVVRIMEILLKDFNSK